MNDERAILVRLAVEASINALTEAVQALVAMEQRACKEIDDAKTEEDKRFGLGIAIGIHAAVTKLAELAQAYGEVEKV